MIYLLQDSLLEATITLVRSMVALIIPVLWSVLFVITPAKNRLGIRALRPRSSHWFVTIAVTGLPTVAAVFLIWPDTPSQLVVWAVAALTAGERLSDRRRGPVVDLTPETSLYTSRLYQAHHYTLFEPKPGIEVACGLVHNNLGFRDHRCFNPDTLAIRLVFLGGPTVYGVTTFDNRYLYTRLLEDRLNSAFTARRGRRRFEVINAGMANATSAEMLLRQIFAVSEIRPSLVAIQAGICDTWPRIASDDYHSDFRQMRKRYGHGRWLSPDISLADSIARALIWRSSLLERWLGHLVPAEPLLECTNHNNSGRTSRLANNLPLYFDRNVRYMLAINREMGARSILIGDPIPVPTQGRSETSYSLAVPEHNKVMENIAGEMGVPFLNLGTTLPLTDDIRDGDKYLNEKGQVCLAEILFHELVGCGLLDALLSENRP